LTALTLAACGGAGADAGPAPNSATAPVPSTPAIALERPADHRLVWADEFDTPGLPDAAKWVYDIGMNKQGWHNRELQYYSHARPENSVVRDGKLVITARKEALRSAPDWGGQAYTSARLITQGKAQWTYGFVEVRAKMPCGKGSWPAIWMLGAEGQWPAGGELDILEHMGQRPDWVFSTVHTTSGSGAHGVGDGRTLATACSQFHNYQMLWTPTEVRFGVDGVQHAVYRNAGTGPAQWPFDKPQFLILNLAIGGDLGGPVDDSIFPLQFEVDHVRVYQRAP
jgi:beta-glucanase (GH16 family)